MDDGCGGAIDCGNCDSATSATCGGAGVPNVCGFPVCQDAYCYQSQHPMLDTQYGIFADVQGRTWTVGVHGSVYMREKGQWISVMAYTRILSDLYSVWVLSETDGWAVGQNGAILRFDGNRFHCQYFDQEQRAEYWSDVKYDLHGIWATGPADVWAVGAEGILHFNGIQWKSELRSSGPLYAIHGFEDGNLVAGGGLGDEGRGGVLLLNYDGSGWESVSIPGTEIKGQIRGFASDTLERVYAVGRAFDEMGVASSGFVLVREGGIWRALATDIPVPLETAAVDALGVLWVGGRGGVLALEAVPGVDDPLGVESGHVLSSEVPILEDEEIYTLKRAGNKVELAGAYGLVGVYDGFWRLNRQKIPGGEAGEKTDVTIWSRAQNDVWAGGDGFVMHWNGTTWGISPLGARIIGFYGVAPGDAFVAGNAQTGGVVYRFNGGAFAEVSRTEEKIAQIAGSSPVDVRVVLENDKILHFDGESWRERERDDFEREVTPQTGLSEWTLDREGFSRTGSEPYQTEIWPFDGLQQPPKAAWGLSTDNIYAGGEDGLIHFDGNKWRKIKSDVSINSITGSAADDVWFAGYDEEGARLLHLQAGELVDIELSEIEEDKFTDVSVDGSGALYVTGKRLYRYASESWEELILGNGETFTAVTAITKDLIWASAGMSIYSFDGVSWSEQQTPDLITQLPLSGNTNVYVDQIFALGPDFVVFRGGTDDGAVAVLLVYADGEWSNRTLEQWGGLASFTALWASGPEHVYVTMGQLGYIYRYQHQFGLFSEVWAPIAEPLSAIWGADENNLWVFGPRGAIMRNVGESDEAFGE